jgi:hypothetical protein
LTEDSLFPSYKNWRRDFKLVFDRHNITDKVIDVIGHSFGTIIMGILLKDKEIDNIIRKRIFIEPVCFIDQSYKIYRYINEPIIEGDVVNSVFNLLVYNDVLVRYVAQRYLYGPEFWLIDYDSMSNNNNLVVVSKQDELVPSSKLYERMKRHNIPTLMVEDAHHADIFISKKFKTLLDRILTYIYDI